MSRMKKWLSLCLAVLLGFSAVPVGAEKSTETAEKAAWTVLIYLCGTDLESKNGMATENLVEISKTLASQDVNVLIETGGTKTWKTKEKLGLDIATDKLQRYRYDANGFTLVEECSLGNMAQAETLTDFIRWGQENYPAEKYMLTLWDHGGGSMEGLIVDELHNNAVMSLEDLGRALDDAGVPLELLLMDTCLMATIETCAVVDSQAHYLVASEETVPGQGSNYKGWLQYLFNNPECSGARLGRIICDTIQQKYAEQGVGAADTVTLSVIDLKKMDAVYTAFDDMFTEIGGLLKNVDDFSEFALAISRSETYYSSEMRDIADMASRASGHGVSTETAKRLVNAVDDAVVYAVKGATHSYSHGISFYYAPTGSKYYMDRYARNCPSASYLAFLDATHMDWTAPAGIYEKMERLPEITYEDYVVAAHGAVRDGDLILEVTNAADAITSVDAVIFSFNETDQNWTRLGTTFKVGAKLADDGSLVYKATFDGKWPMINNVICQMNIIEENMSYTLFGIPLMINNQAYELRAAYVFEESLEDMYNHLLSIYAADDGQTAEEKQENLVNGVLAIINGNFGDDVDPYEGQFQVYGIWNGENSGLQVPGRNVISLSEAAGAPATLVATNFDITTMKDLDYTSYGDITIERNITVEEGVLPAGTYAYSFLITDVLDHTTVTEPMIFVWNGEEADLSAAYTMTDYVTVFGAVLNGDAEALGMDQETVDALAEQWTSAFDHAATSTDVATPTDTEK